MKEGSIEILRNLLFEKVSVGGRPLEMVATLARATEGLNASIGSRNAVISNCKARGEDPAFDLPAIYFGVPNARGHVDTTFPDTVNGIASQTDDGIVFSKFIGEDLVIHGEKLAKSYKKKPPRISKPDFSDAEKRRLIPNSELYAGWIDSFHHRQEAPEERRISSR